VELHGPTQDLLKEPGRKVGGHFNQSELWLILNQWEVKRLKHSPCHGQQWRYASGQMWIINFLHIGIYIIL